MLKQTRSVPIPAEQAETLPEDLVAVLRREYSLSDPLEEACEDSWAEMGWDCPAAELDARLARYASL